MEKVLITGSAGLLGSSLKRYKFSGELLICTHAVTSEADHKFDLRCSKQTSYFLNQINPDIIINLVGLASVELCETSPTLAYETNCKTVENIVSWAQSTTHNPYIIHISTDQVYDGGGPHSEDSLCLTNTYAITKYAAEIALRSWKYSTILRTNFLGKSLVPDRQSMTDWLHYVLIHKENAHIFKDIYFSPLSIHELCKQINTVLLKRELGIFNLGSKEGMSKADFDLELAKLWKLPCDRIQSCLSTDVDFLKAYRPKDMRLCCDLYEKTFKIKLPTLMDLIPAVAAEYYV